jgi:hypothetical protein
VLAAATARAEADAVTAQTLAEVTALAEHCLLAELPDALGPVMRILADRAALDTDVGHLAQALPALVRSLRYGDVRGTGTGALAEVAAGLAERIFVGLPPACAALDADAAQEMRRHVDAVHGAVGLLGDTPAPGHGALRARWRDVLRTLSARDTVPGVVRGRAVRLLLDDGELPPDEAARLMGLVLSPGTRPADAAAWIEGFVGGGSGGGMLLLHDERLLALVDAWLTGVPAEAFTDVLPLLRRTFSAYEPGVRRSIGELVRRGPEGRGAATAAGAGVPGFAADLDTGRADAVLQVVRQLLGLDDGCVEQAAGGAYPADSTVPSVPSVLSVPSVASDQSFLPGAADPSDQSRPSDRTSPSDQSRPSDRTRPPDRTDPSGQSDRVALPDWADRTDRTDRGDRTDRTDRADRTDRVGPVSQVGRAGPAEPVEEADAGVVPQGRAGNDTVEVDA